jgi:hypothetical protein
MTTIGLRSLMKCLADDLRDSIAYAGDNLLFATLIDDLSRRNDENKWQRLRELTQFDIHHTLPGLQHDFCTLWNELVQLAGSQGHYTIPVYILRDIRRLYIALIKAPMLPRLRSLLTPTISTTFCTSHRHIHCATSPGIVQSRPLFPIPLLSLFSPNLVVYPALESGCIRDAPVLVEGRRRCRRTQSGLRPI